MIGSDRSTKLICPQTKQFTTLPVETQQLVSHFEACSSDGTRPKIVFVSKMFAVSRDQLSEHRAKPLTEQELLARRTAARDRHKEKLLGTAEGAVPLVAEQIGTINLSEQAENEPEHVFEFIAFARIFSGTLKQGDQVF